jgi:glycine/sarcosine/dimethylglycine N-methyltransferase
MPDNQLLADDTYRKEYTKDFVSAWDDLIGWEGREAGEAGFFHRLLNAYGCEEVVDVGCGTGFHSVVLAKDGFKVTACDGAATMVERTKENAAKEGVQLEDARVADWLNLKKEFGENRFDALICLGNAFTHLFEHESRRDALEAMFAVVKPGGLVIIDHRNYDSMLDHGFSTKHAYYYTGNGVDARPVIISRTLCKFQYSFPSGDTFHLQMYPLRQNYMNHLLEDAGFVDITRYGDFHRPYDHYDVDFVQQVAFKPLDPQHGVRPKRKETAETNKQKKLNRLVREAREYYDGAADEIYRDIWGENIHIGTFELMDESLQSAMVRSNQRVGDLMDVSSRHQVLDVGCGYGAFARYLSHRFGCRVLATNISERELEWGRELTGEAGLDDLVGFEWADFHDLPYDVDSFDYYTSQEAFLHAADKKVVLAETHRVLKPGGKLVFTDLLVRKDTPEEDREKIYERIKLSDMWDGEDYLAALKEQGFEIEVHEDWSENVAPTYAWVREQLLDREEEFAERIGQDLVTRTANALQFWVDAANDGKIGWACFIAKK